MFEYPLEVKLVGVEEGVLPPQSIKQFVAFSPGSQLPFPQTGVIHALQFELQ